MTAAAAASALTSTWGLALLAATTAGDDPRIAADLHMSTRIWTAANPVPRTTALLAVSALALAAVRLALTAHRRRRAYAHAAALCTRPGQPDGELLVLPDPRPCAFAVPGRPGRIAVSTGMLTALDGAGRRVLLAHERAHLTHVHHRYQTITALAAALNPLLRPTHHAVAFTCERWADEDASAAVGSRTLTARTLAQAALASATHTSPLPPAPAFERLAIIQRLAALHTPPPPRRPLLTTLLVAPAGLAVLAAADATLALGRLLLAAHTGP